MANGNGGGVTTSASTSGLGVGQQMNALQQQWMWQQMYQNYGNFVPNFTFAPETPPVFWDHEEEEEVEEEESVEIIRQPTHAISEDEAEDSAEPGPLPPTMVLVKAVPREVENVESVAELIKEHLTHVKEANKVTPDVQSQVAELIDGFLEEACLISEMEKLAKKYPRVNNVPRMKVQKLDAEVFQVVEQGLRNTDQTFQAIQKGVLGGMAAIAPLMGLTLMRNTGDKELNRLGSNLVDALHLLAQANNALAA